MRVIYVLILNNEVTLFFLFFRNKFNRISYNYIPKFHFMYGICIFKDLIEKVVGGINDCNAINLERKEKESTKGPNNIANLFQAVIFFFFSMDLNINHSI